MFNSELLHEKVLSLTNQKHFLIAYSGGMDSHVLLHSLANLRDQHPELQLRAAHIHHGLSPKADQWVLHCQKICNELQVPLVVKHVDVDSRIRKNDRKHSLEAIARELRYEKLAKILNKDKCLVTAHHANDQAETLLLQLFRGSGPKGLAAMPKHKGFAQGTLLRPLLDFPRADLQQYAQQHKLNWIEDESNKNIGMDRNFIRHQLLPIIKQRWPGINNTMARVARHCAQANDLLELLAEQDYLIVTGSVVNTLSISKLLTLDDARQNNVLRYWLRQLDLPIPSDRKIQHIKTDVLHCRQDANPLVHWPGAEVRRYRDNIYAMTPGDENKSIIQFRYDAKHGKISKKLFQKWGIPPWQRARIKRSINSP